MFFYRWIQKELFFFASLAFVFISTASVGSFVKHHLHQNAPTETVARVVWPDNQPAIYPETPPPSFFEAQKTTQVASEPIPATALEKVVNAPPLKRSLNTSRPVVAVSRRTAPYRYSAQRPRVSAPKPPQSYRLSHYKATQAKKAPRPKTQTPQANSSVDTQSLRAYDVHMKWVRKTLAEYQEKQPSP